MEKKSDEMIVGRCLVECDSDCINEMQMNVLVCKHQRIVDLLR